jgi:hypothetical protein
MNFNTSPKRERQVAVWVNGLMGFLCDESEALKYFEEEKDHYEIAQNNGSWINLDKRKKEES